MGPTIDDLEPPGARLLLLDAAGPGQVRGVAEQDGEVDGLVARQAANGDE